MTLVFNVKTGVVRKYGIPAHEAVRDAWGESNPCDGTYGEHAIPSFTAFDGTETDPSLGLWRCGDWVAIGPSKFTRECLDNWQKKEI